VQFIYPYDIHQSDDGAWQVRFPDVPEALTEGESAAEAHALASDVLLAALGGLARLKRELPAPSVPRPDQHVVIVPMLQAAKLALYQAMREAKLNNVTLAARLGKAENQVRRMLDLDHESKIGEIENALWLLGRRVATEVRLAA